ncbi:threonine/homoserine/homoserine lactone efflux protein [Pseudarthrobacter defluvii]|uniref:Threonine/homoserine/homoserine lactone efflux protein n=1 Tax=Pseudarthrobacter defluvii TaxID=410837 RepID=A0ABT9UJ12_9MICC|nr:LysE family translocator [Pseudarthrobacter defluvii]MDQ0119628.1 threonine/homoserine/homoserine lactone efflux protein [Pseudarthrobacter defluvii]
MTLTQAVLSFAVVAGLLTLVPGIDTALVLRSSITRSRGYAFSTALGISTGAMVWGVAAAVGVSALLAASELAYRILTLAGAAYMVWLGVSLLWKSRAKAGPGAGVPAAATVPAAGNGQLVRGWATGAGTNLLNPKVGVFYIATIPQFIPAGSSPLLMGVVLAGVHCLLTMAWFTLLIFGSQLASKWLKGQRSMRIVDRITGTVLVGFGLKLAATPGH